MVGVRSRAEAAQCQREQRRQSSSIVAGHRCHPQSISDFRLPLIGVRRGWLEPPPTASGLPLLGAVERKTRPSVTDLWPRRLSVCVPRALGAPVHLGV